MRKEALKCVGAGVSCLRLREMVPKTAWSTAKFMSQYAIILASESRILAASSSAVTTVQHTHFPQTLPFCV